MKNNLNSLSAGRFLGITLTLLLFNLCVSAQNEGNGAWFFLSHTQKLGAKFDLLADVQLRSSEHFSDFSTILLRSAVNYHFNKKHAVAIGYAHKGDFEITEGKRTYLPEQRIYEQYSYNFTTERMEMMIRGRLEQRWVKDTRYQNSQRARILLSAQIPMIADSDFNQGVYANIQNELFLNIQHKDHVNGSLLDQNRPYISAGYRFSKNMDMEFGYTRWFQREFTGDEVTHVMQLMITTSL